MPRRDGARTGAVLPALFSLLLVAGRALGAAQGSPGPSTGATSAGPAVSPAPSPAFPIAYERPDDPALLPYRDIMRERRVLERISHALAFIRLPGPLLLRTAQCDESNAWYDPDTRSVTFCYEYLKELAEDAKASPPALLSREEAVAGSFVFLFLHEMGHALFDLLDVPVLGREEDAADQVSAYLLLRVGPDLAKRTLAAAAWMYRASAGKHGADESDFADVHGLDAQRYYNVLCLAYGSDPKEYAVAAGEQRLPKERAEGCADEFKQVDHAVRKTMTRGFDRKAFSRLQKERAAARRAPPRTRE